MGLLDIFKRRKPKPARTAEAEDPLMSQIAAAYPSGPVRRGSLKGIPRYHDLSGKGAVIDEIVIFDAGDHWFCLCLGCRALGLPYELSFRTAKSSADSSPPDWFVEPVTRVANAIGDGAECAPGVTWVIGSPLGDASSTFTGFVTLQDVQFGTLEPSCLLQLVPATQAELGCRGDDLAQLCDRLQNDRSRMTGVSAFPRS